MKFDQHSSTTARHNMTTREERESARTLSSCWQSTAQIQICHTSTSVVLLAEHGTGPDLSYVDICRPVGRARHRSRSVIRRHLSSCRQSTAQVQICHTSTSVVLSAEHGTGPDLSSGMLPSSSGAFVSLTLSLPTILLDAVSSQDHSPEKARQTEIPQVSITVFHVIHYT